ncbi:MAG: ferritin-like domain-containing protein [Candidatus Omnitrophica bacterium]|nr:ferritin-like domain-containing protein [Candidatus Omnitrophota bacterium]MDE2222251.1 ferritin-like domain-containing protein [Candidatus Omnitrophota bacterium]
MNKIKSLDELFLEELKDLYSAENQLISALPKMAQATVSDELRMTIENHLQQTKNHASRLEEVFKELGQKPSQVTCKAMKGLIEEGEEMIRKSDKGPACDAGIIGSAQRVEHYEIAAYGTAQSHASLLGYNRIGRLLEDTLGEEKEADSKLNQIAQESVNAQANQKSPRSAGAI